MRPEYSKAASCVMETYCLCPIGSLVVWRLIQVVDISKRSLWPQCKELPTWQRGHWTCGLYTPYSFAPALSLGGSS